MTEQETLKRLKDILDEVTTDENAICYVTDYDEIPLRLAIKALEKQIPQKPKYEETEREELKMDSGDIIISIGINYCPSCGEIIIGKPNYCPNCGQAIKWEQLF